jgi:hypothetical protein
MGFPAQSTKNHLERNRKMKLYSNTTEKAVAPENPKNYVNFNI